jgi:hypothetical protein
MSISLIINGNTYNYPAPGENPQWGSDASDWAQAVTNVISTLLSPGDILASTFSINNYVTSDANINGLLFDTGTIRAATIDYAVYRISTSSTSGHAETGKIYIVYDDNGSSGSKWSLSQRSNGDSGVVFNITDNGQFTYKSTDIGSAGYSGSIRFSAKALTKI